MPLTLRTYLDRVKQTNTNTIEEHESLLKMLHSDEAIEIMWETFTLQCNAAMKGNESVENSIEVHNISTRYLAALNTCRMLHTRFDSVTRLIYDLKSLDDRDISDVVKKSITENKLFDLNIQNADKSDKIVKLLEDIQCDIKKSGKSEEEILEQIIQCQCKILFIALLIGDSDNADVDYTLLIKSDLDQKDNDLIKLRLLGKYFNDNNNYRTILSMYLFETINAFHKYLAEISNKEEE